MTEVQTLSQQLKAAVVNNTCLQKSRFCVESCSLPNFESTSRKLDDWPTEDKHNWISKFYFRRLKMGSKRWREAAVETDKQALGSQTTLQGFLVEEETRRSPQYRSYETVQAKTQCFPTGRDPMPKEGIHRKKTPLVGNSLISENHRTQVSQTSDLKVEVNPKKKRVQEA